MEKLSNKYLTFILGEEHYAIPILKVKEIIGMMEIKKVPRLPEFCKGVINLRGKIIPIIDLRLKFNLGEKDYDDRTSIIVVELETEEGIKSSGMVVDAVNEVLDIDQDHIAPPPKYGKGIDRTIITGIGKKEGSVLIIVDINRILSVEEINLLKEL